MTPKNSSQTISRYTGKGAVGTSIKKSGISPAVIGGSIGGTLGAMSLIASGIIIILYRKKKNASSKTPDQPIIFQQMNASVSTTTKGAFPFASQPPSPGPGNIPTTYTGASQSLLRPVSTGLHPNVEYQPMHHFSSTIEKGI
jgi:hypothetical protein